MELMTEVDAAKLLGLSVGTLQQWRHLMRGPPYRKMRSAVRYSKTELEEFKQARRPGSEIGRTMSDSIQMQWVDEKQAAKLLCIALQTLRNWRVKGYGPNYHKFGKSVRYSLAGLQAFSDASVVIPAKMRVDKQ